MLLYILIFFVIYRELEFPDTAKSLSVDRDFELQGYLFSARVESSRPPRVVRVGAIQTKIVLPTSAPIMEQVFYGFMIEYFR